MKYTSDIAIPASLLSAAVISSPGEPIGLARTEFLFVGWSHWPTFEEQRVAYTSLFRAASCRVARVRVFDISREKTPWASDTRAEQRGLRYLLTRKELLSDQLEAVSEAAASEAVRVEIVAPYVIDAGDAQEFLSLVRQTSFSEVAIMIETPAAVLLAPWYTAGYDTAILGVGDLVPLLVGYSRSDPAPNLEAGTVDKCLQIVTDLAKTSAHEIHWAACGAYDVALLTRVCHAVGIYEIIVPQAEIADVRNH
jgi:phosphotransferase system enzyme I (PtsI)